MNEQQFNSLPLEQRKIAQKRLLELGLYNGDTDGKWGAGTKAAFELETSRAREESKAAEAAGERKRADDLRAQEIEVARIQAQGTKGTADAEAAEAARKTAAQQARDAEAGTPLGLAALTGATVAAVPAGGAVGRGSGMLINALMNQSQSAKNETLKGLAEDRVRGLTTREGARTAAQVAGVMPASNPVMRVGGRMLPHGILAAGLAGKGGSLLAGADEDGPFYPEMVNRGAGLGMIGAGAGMLERGVAHANAPLVPPDARSIAIIESNQLRRNGPQGGALSRALSPDIIDLTAEEVRPAQAAIEGPAKPQPSPGSVKYMKDQAKALGLKGYSNLGKTELSTRLAEAMAEHGGKRTVAKRLPKPPSGTGAAALAGGLAYALTPDRAEAADGTSRGGTGEALTNAGIAGGGAYGVSKLAQALGPAMRGALGMSDGMAPASIDAMTDYSPDDLAQGRNMLARNLPGAMRGGAVEDAYQMAQVPTPGDRSDPAMLARAQTEQAAAMPMASAAALEIPEGIPAPREDGASPYAPAIMGRLQRMQQTGATPEQIASWLNQAVR